MLSSPFCKNILISRRCKSVYIASHPVPNKRGVAQRHERWDGMRWTRGGAKDEGVFSRTAKSCGPDTPTLVSDRRSNPPTKVANKPGTPGRARRKPLKPFACGNAGMSRCDRGDYARVLFIICTRGCGCIVRPAFPTPFVFGGEEFEAQPRRIAFWECSMLSLRGAKRRSNPSCHAKKEWIASLRSQ